MNKYISSQNVRPPESSLIQKFLRLVDIYYESLDAKKTGKKVCLQPSLRKHLIQCGFMWSLNWDATLPLHVSSYCKIGFGGFFLKSSCFNYLCLVGALLATHDLRKPADSRILWILAQDHNVESSSILGKKFDMVKGPCVSSYIPPEGLFLIISHS